MPTTTHFSVSSIDCQFSLSNAQVELRADQINASGASYQSPLVCSNER